VCIPARSPVTVRGELQGAAAPPSRAHVVAVTTLVVLHANVAVVAGEDAGFSVKATVGGAGGGGGGGGAGGGGGPGGGGGGGVPPVVTPKSSAQYTRPSAETAAPMPVARHPAVSMFARCPGEPSHAAMTAWAVE
jgi:hypothetical protein